MFASSPMSPSLQKTLASGTRSGQATCGFRRDYGSASHALVWGLTRSKISTEPRSPTGGSP
eukprot:11054818-Karenia_brevis.AAC.1